MEGVFLPGLGDVGLERPRDVGGNEGVTSGEGPMGPELVFHLFVGGELTQALGNLSAVLDREEPQVTTSWAKHEVVCLPYLFVGGSEGGEDVGKARAGELPDNAVEVALLASDGGHLGCVDVDFGIPGQHLRFG